VRRRRNLKENQLLSASTQKLKTITPRVQKENRIN